MTAAQRWDYDRGDAVRPAHIWFPPRRHRSWRWLLLGVLTGTGVGWWWLR